MHPSRLKAVARASGPQHEDDYEDISAKSFYRRQKMKKGKSTKSAKTKDFPKKRRKVGKGKRVPENTTAISFKTGAVVVPAQLEESQEPTTKKKLPIQV